MAVLKNLLDKTLVGTKGKRRTLKDSQIVEKFLELRASADSDAQAIFETSAELGVASKKVSRAINRKEIKAQAKQIRVKITEELFKDKIPMMKNIVGVSLHKTLAFLKDFEPSTIDDVRALALVFKDIQMMLRLDMGQSTENIAVQHSGNYTVEQTQKLLVDLQTKDKIFLEGLFGRGTTAIALPSPGASAPSGGPEQALRQSEQCPPEAPPRRADSSS